MYFGVEQFGTLLGRFFGLFLLDLEQFGTPKKRIWNTLAKLLILF
jgi:hypothetical protein